MKIQSIVNKTQSKAQLVGFLADILQKSLNPNTDLAAYLKRLSQLYELSNKMEEENVPQMTSLKNFLQLFFETQEKTDTTV